MPTWTVPYHSLLGSLLPLCASARGLTRYTTPEGLAPRSSVQLLVQILTETYMDALPHPLARVASGAVRCSGRFVFSALLSSFYLSIKMFSSSLPAHGYLSSMPWLAHPSIHPSELAGAFLPPACLSLSRVASKD